MNIGEGRHVSPNPYPSSRPLTPNIVSIHRTLAVQYETRCGASGLRAKACPSTVGTASRAEPALPGAIMSKFIASATLVAMLCLPGAAQAKDRIEADLILTNARIYTVEDKQPWAEAVAIKDGQIVEVGSTASVAKLRGAATRRSEERSGGQDGDGTCYTRWSAEHYKNTKREQEQYKQQ